MTDTDLRQYEETRTSNNNLFPTLFLPHSHPYGISYGRWTAIWWQWALSIPKDKNPLIDSTGKYSAQGQTGHVWFLAGTTGKMHFAERRCVIPGDKSILFPIIVSQFSLSELQFIHSDQDLISHTAKDINQWSLLEATVDGINLQDLSDYRIQFGPFDLSLPPGNIWNVQEGLTRAVSDGFWVFLRPLDKGNHTIQFHGIEPNFESKVTYKILIT